MKRQSAAISVILFISMMSGLIVSCGNDVKKNDNTTDSSIVETTTEAISEYKIPNVNYNGEEFSFYLNHFQANWKLSEYNAILAEEENGDIINDAIYTRTGKVEDELGVKITVFKEDNNVNALTASILAGDNSYDAAIVQQMHLPKLFSDDMLYNLRDIDTLDLTKSWWLQSANDEYLVAGKQFTVIGDLCLNSMVATSALYFNKDMVTEYNLENPYDLVFQGKWTLDKWVELTRGVSNDINGDSAMDENDVFGNAGSATVMQHMIIASDIRVSTKNNNGVSEFTLNNEKTLNVIDKVLAVLRDKSVSIYPDDYASKFSGDLFGTMLQPMFKSNQLLFNFNWLFCALDLRDMENDFGILPMPKYDENQKNYHSYLSAGWAQYLTVPITNGKTEMTGYVLDAMGYYSQQIIYPEVIERSISVKGMRDNDSAAVMDILYQNIVFDLYDVYLWGNIFNIARDCVSANQNNFASSYASRVPAAQMEINKTFGVEQ